MRTGYLIAAVTALAFAAGVAPAAVKDVPDTSRLPASARPGPGGILAELAVPGAGRHRWHLLAYRAKVSDRRLGPGIPGAVDYCVAIFEGPKRWRGIGCALSASMALELDRHGLWTSCGVGLVAGLPAPPTPTCGLAAGDVESMTVSAEGGPSQPVELSAPFGLRLNRSARILRRADIDPERVRRLPDRPSVRAFLAFVETPPTPPGERTPRLTVTATRADGGTLVRRLGGEVFPEPPEPPPLRPPRGVKRVRLAATGPDGRRWTSVAWRAERGGLCASARRGESSRHFSLGCHGSLQLFDHFFHRGGVTPYTGSVGRGAGSYPVYGFVRGDARALAIVTRTGRTVPARLSPVWTTLRRRGGDHLRRFRGLPRRVRVRAFLAVLPGRPRPARGVEIRTTLGDGRTLVHEP